MSGLSFTARAGWIVVWVVTLGGCFEGGSTFGQPCIDDAACSAGLVCSDAGRCVGPDGDAATGDGTAGATSGASSATDSSETTESGDAGPGPCSSTLDCPEGQFCQPGGMGCANIDDPAFPAECADLPRACHDMCARVLPCGYPYDAMLAECTQLSNGTPAECERELEEMAACMGAWACESEPFGPNTRGDECMQSATRFGTCMLTDQRCGDSTIPGCSEICVNSLSCEGTAVDAALGRCYATPLAWGACPDEPRMYFDCLGPDICPIIESSDSVCLDTVGDYLQMQGCTWVTCGDGILMEPYEQCEDGNILDGDGCSFDCQNE